MAALLRGAPDLRVVSLLPPPDRTGPSKGEFANDARAIAALGALHSHLGQRSADRPVQLRLSAQRLAALAELPLLTAALDKGDEWKLPGEVSPAQRAELEQLAARLRADRRNVVFSERREDFGECTEYTTSRALRFAAPD